jgi:electron transport complex protein RnfB
MIAAVLTIGGLAAGFGLLLGYSSIRFRVEGDPVVDAIDGLLPQTQCGQCEFAGCRPYAEAIARGEAPINRCAPGGEATMLAIADLLDRDPIALDPSYDKSALPRVAVIDEQTCIGCTKCIQACPVDAILGAAKHMHTVIATECTGCELCLPPCPVDCIEMVPIEPTLGTWKWPTPPDVVAEVHP